MISTLGIGFACILNLPIPYGDYVVVMTLTVCMCTDLLASWIWSLFVGSLTSKLYLPIESTCLFIYFSNEMLVQHIFDILYNSHDCVEILYMRIFMFTCWRSSRCYFWTVSSIFLKNGEVVVAWNFHWKLAWCQYVMGYWPSDVPC